MLSGWQRVADRARFTHKWPEKHSLNYRTESRAVASPLEHLVSSSFNLILCFYCLLLIDLPLQAANIIPQFAFKLPPDKYPLKLIVFMFNTLYCLISILPIKTCGNFLFNWDINDPDFNHLKSRLAISYFQLPFIFMLTFALSRWQRV